jgi:UPF0755 protein
VTSPGVGGPRVEDRGEHWLLESPEEPAHRPRWRRLRHGVVLVVSLVVVVGLAGLAFVGLAAGLRKALHGAADYPGSGDGQVTVQVQKGDTLAVIGASLQQAGVVKSADAFTTAANRDPNATKIQPGTYRMREHMKASVALALMLDPATLVNERVVIPEGTPVRGVLALIAKDTSVPLASLQALAANPAGLALPAVCQGALEGCLFPATYTFQPGVTAHDALAAMVTKFAQEDAALGVEAKAAQTGRSAHDVLVIASIVQREARPLADDGKIARVFYNRLAHGMRLDADSTLDYVLPPGHGQLTASDLAMNSPYNTRKYAGLPPTPISNPGADAIQAALDPTPGPWLYFVTIDKQGHAAFATTLQEHERNVAQAKKNGVPL